MDYTDSTQRAYDVIAEDLADDPSAQQWDDDYLDLFASLLPPAADVLDLGCGPGIEIKRFRIRGFHIHGLDISDRVLAVARRLNRDTLFTRGDMRKLPFADGTFSGMFAKASLYHISKPDVPTVLAEVRRVLVPSGVFHVAVMKKRAGQRDGFVTEEKYGIPNMQYVAYWTMRELKEYLTKGGFTVTHAEETAVHDAHTVWIKLIARRTD